MQQGVGSPYGISPEMTPFTASTRTHMLSISGSDQLPQPSHPQHIQQKPGDPNSLAEAASPVSSRAPVRNFEELVTGTANFPDDDAVAGEDADRGATGNRWPRQETLALLKIRSEMDAAFRDATLKGPLWEDVSRRLAELGYSRSAKKCKEKFENVLKYYKRTKEGRAGRQDGKSYRFFTQLEALHRGGGSGSSGANLSSPPGPISASNSLALQPVSAGIPGVTNPLLGSGRTPLHALCSLPSTHGNTTRIATDLKAGLTAGPSDSAGAGGVSFSSNSSSSSEDYSEEETEEGVPMMDSRKRKRSGYGGNRKMMAFFETLIKQVMERQEAMQQRFLETIEKREQDRMIREEAWKRQEMARLAREHELMAQERAMAASRDAAVIAFLQKFTGQAVQVPHSVLPASTVPQTSPQPTQPPTVQQSTPPTPTSHSTPNPAAVVQPTPSTQPSHHHYQTQYQYHALQPLALAQLPQPPPPPTGDSVQHRHPSTSMDIIPVHDPQHPQQSQDIVIAGSYETSSSRWPKAEVHALIKLRSGLESRYQEAGPKGPLWEEISAGMLRLGYNRSSKRCKEKWENINKYFKKVKESNKKRPEDAKTCPYFHLLDALYRKKILGGAGGCGGGGGGGGAGGSGGARSSLAGEEAHRDLEMNPNTCSNAQQRGDVLTIMPPALPQPLTDNELSNNDKNGKNGEGSSNVCSSLQVQTSNGGLPPNFFESVVKKPEDIVKELLGQHPQQQSMADDYDKLEEESDNMDEEEEEDYDEEVERGLTYRIQFQGQDSNSSSGGGNLPAARSSRGSFLAMVQ